MSMRLWGGSLGSLEGPLPESYVVLRHYRAISSGRAALRVTWRIGDPKDKDKLLACPSTMVEVDIPPADKEHLAKLRKRLEAKMEEARKLAEKEQAFLAAPDRPVDPSS